MDTLILSYIVIAFILMIFHLAFWGVFLAVFNDFDSELMRAVLFFWEISVPIIAIVAFVSSISYSVSILVEYVFSHIKKLIKKEKNNAKNNSS